MNQVLLPPPDPADEERAKAVLRSSRIVVWIDRALDIPGEAWKSSTVRRMLTPTIARVQAADAPEQLRLVGVVLLIAAVTHIVLYLVFSGAVGWPTWTGWTGFVVAAAVIAAKPREVIAAWKDSTVRRWLTRRAR